MSTLRLTTYNSNNQPTTDLPLPSVLQAEAGVQYSIATERGAKTPRRVKVLRQGDDMVVVSGNTTVTVIKDFYRKEGATLSLFDKKAVITPTTPAKRVIDSDEAVIWEDSDDLGVLAALALGGGGGAGVHGSDVPSAQAKALGLETNFDLFAADGLTLRSGLPNNAVVGDRAFLTVYRDGLRLGTIEVEVTQAHLDNGRIDITIPANLLSGTGTYSAQLDIKNSDGSATKGSSETEQVHINNGDTGMALNLFNDSDPGDGLNYRVELPDEAIAGDTVRVSLFFNGATQPSWTSVDIAVTQADVDAGFVAGLIPQLAIATDGPYDGKADLLSSTGAAKDNAEAPGFFIVFNGIVHDDYYAGAEVFVDRNRNNQWDPGEDRVQTNSRGEFYFATNPNGAPVLAIGGVDTASGAPNRSSVFKTFPTGVVGAGIDVVLSPLTTLIASIAEQQNGGNVTAAVLQAAASSAMQALGISGISPQELIKMDPIANGLLNTDSTSLALVTINRQVSLLMASAGALVDGAIAGPSRDGSIFASQEIAKLLLDAAQNNTAVNFGSVDTVRAIVANTMAAANDSGKTDDLRASRDEDLDAIADLLANVSERIQTYSSSDMMAPEVIALMRAVYENIVPALETAGTDAQQQRGGDISLADALQGLMSDTRSSSDSYLDQLVTDAMPRLGSSFETSVAKGFIGDQIPLTVLLPNLDLGQTVDRVEISNLPAGVELWILDPVTLIRTQLTPDSNGVFTFTNLTQLGYLTVRATSEAFDRTDTADIEGAITLSAFWDNNGTPAQVDSLLQLDVRNPTIVPRASIVSVLDQVGSSTGALTSGTDSDDSRPLMQIAVDRPLSAGQRVVVYANGVAIGEAVADGSGGYSFRSPQALPAGTLDLVARIENSDGEQISASPRFVMNVELPADRLPTPQPTSVADLDPALDDGSSNSDNTTSIRQPSFFIGPLPPGAENPELLINGVPVPSVYDPATGTLTPVNPLPVGDLDVTFRYVDEFGIPGAPSDALSMTVLDNTAILSVEAMRLVSYAAPALEASVQLSFLVVRTQSDAAANVSWTLGGLPEQFFPNGYPSGTVTFAAGESQKVVTVNVASSEVANLAGTAVLTLSDASNGFHIDPDNMRASAVIDPVAVFNDPTVTTFTISSNRGSEINEGSAANSGLTTITFTVTRSGGDITAARDVDIRVLPRGQALISASDFVANVDTLGDNNGLPSGTLRFAANQLSQTFTVTVRGDNLVGPNESFALSLDTQAGEPVKGDLLTTIANDDADIAVSLAAGLQAAEIAHRFVVSRSGATHLNHSVTYTLEPSGELGQNNLNSLLDMPLTGTITFAAGETQKFIDVPRLPNIPVEALQTFALRLNAADASNVNLVNTTAVSRILPNLQDIEITGELDRALEGTTNGLAAGEFVYRVSRSGMIDQEAVIQWSVRGTGENPVAANDFAGGTLPGGDIRFAAGQTTAEIRFRPALDSVLEGEEGFVIDLITDDPAIRVLTPAVDGSLIDDESALGFSTARAFSALEGDEGAQFLVATVTRIGFAGAESTVEWRVNPGTAVLTDFAPGQDLLGNNNGFPSGVVALLPGEVTGIARIRMAVDSVLESDETFGITLSNASSNTKLIGVDVAFPGYSNSASGVIVNDDSVLSIASPTYQQIEDHGGSSSMMHITVRREGSTAGTDWVRWNLYSGDNNPADGADVGGTPTAQAVFTQAAQSWIDVATLSGTQTESGSVTLTKSGYLMVAYNRGQAFQDANNENIPFDRFLLDNLHLTGGGSLEFVGNVTQGNFVADDVAVSTGSGNIFSASTPVALPGAQGNRVVLSSDSNLAGMYFQVTGTDGEGNVISETVRGPANGMVATERAFATVTAIDSVPAKLSLAVQYHPLELSEIAFDDVFDNGSGDSAYDVNLSGGIVQGEWLTSNNSYASWNYVSGAKVFTGSNAGQLIFKSSADLSGTQFLVQGGVTLANFARDANGWTYSDFVESFPDNNQIDLESFLGLPSQVKFEQTNGITQSLDNSTADSVFTLVGVDANGNLIRETINVPEFDADSLVTLTDYTASSGNALVTESTLATPGRVMFSYAGSAPSTSLVFTVMGTNAQGDVITDQVRLTSESNTSAGTSKTFHTVTSITASESFTGTVQVGSSVPVYSTAAFSKVLGIIPDNANIDHGKVEVTVDHSFVVQGGLPGTSVLEHSLNFVRSIEVLPSLSNSPTLDVGFEQPTDTYHTLTLSDLTNWSDVSYSANQITAITLGSLGGSVQINTGSPSAPVWEALTSNTLDVDLLAQGAYRLVNPARARDMSGLDSATSAQTTAVDALRAMPNGYALRYDDLYSDSWSDAGNDLYDGGNRLSIGGTQQSIWNTTNNTSASTATFGNYVFRTTPSGTALLIDNYDASDFRITGNLGADGSGSRVSGEITGFSGLRVFYQITYGSGDPSLHKLVVTNASNPSFTSATNTDDEDFWIQGLGDATFVHYFVLASNSSGFYSEDQLRNFVSALAPEVAPFNATVSLSNGSSVVVSGGDELIPTPTSAHMLVENVGGQWNMSSQFPGGAGEMAYAILKVNAGAASPDAPVTLHFDMQALGRAGIDTASLSYAPDGLWSVNLQDAADSTTLLIPALSGQAVYSILDRTHFAADIDSNITGIYVDEVRHGQLQVNTGSAEAPVWTALDDYLEDEDTDVLDFSVIDAGRVRYSGNTLIVEGRFDEDGSDRDEQVFTIQNPTPVAPAVAHSEGSVSLTESGYIWVRFANTSNGAEGADRATINNLHVTGGGTLSVVGQKVLTQAIAQEQTLAGAGDVAINGSASARSSVALPVNFDGSLMVFVSRDPDMAHLQSGAYTAVGRTESGDTITLTGAWTTTDMNSGGPIGFAGGSSIRLSGLESLVSIESLRIHEFTAAMRSAEEWGSNSPYQLGEPVVSIVAGDFKALSTGHVFDAGTWSQRGVWFSASHQTTNADLRENSGNDLLDDVSNIELTAGTVSGTFSSGGGSGADARIISFGTLFPDNLDGATVLISGTDGSNQAISETLTFDGDSHVLSSALRYQGSVSYTVTARTGVTDGSFSIQASSNLVARWGDPQAVVAFHNEQDSPSFVVTGLDAQGQYLAVQFDNLTFNTTHLVGVFSEVFAVQSTESNDSFRLSFADAPGGVFDLYEEVPLTGARDGDGLIALGGEQRVVLGNGISSHILSYKVVGRNAQGDVVEEIIHNIANGSYSNSDLSSMDGSSVDWGDDGRYPGVFGITENYFTHIEGVYVSAYHPNGGTGELSVGSVGVVGRPLIEDQAISPYGEMVQLGGVQAQMGTASRISLASDDNLSDRSFTITGTGINGQVLTETIQGPSSGIVLSTNSFITVTRIQTTAGAAGEIKVGYVSQNGGLTDNFVVTGSGTAADPFVAHSTNTLENGSDGARTAGELTNEADILFYLNTSNATGPVTLHYDLSVQGGAGDTLYMEYSSNIVPLLDGRLEFADGESEATILIPIAGDDQREANETMTLKLGSSSAGTTVNPNASSTQLTIQDDDDSVTIDSAQLERAEGNATAGDFTVILRRLDANTSKTVRWHLEDLGDTGEASNDDFTQTSGTVTFAAGSLTATVRVPVVNDRVLEANETFRFVLSDPSLGSGYSLTGVTSAAGVIRNDDVRVTIAATTTGLAEGSGANVAHVFTLTREGDLSQSSAVQYAVTAGNTANTVGANGSDFGGALPAGTVTFAAGATGTHGTESQTLTINSVGNSYFTGDTSFVVTLSNASGDTSEISAVPAVGRIVEDDSITLTSANLAQAEGTNANEPTTITYTLQRSGDTSRALTLNWAAQIGESDGAKANDFVGGVLPSGQVTFAAGSATATLSVAVQADAIIERDERFTLRFTSADSSSASGTLTGVIVGDDVGFGVDPKVVELAEGNSGTTALRVVLVRAGQSTTANSYDWAVRYVDTSDSDPASLANFSGLTAGSVSFAIGETEKEITLNIVGNSDFDVNRTFVVDMKDGATTLASSPTITIRNDDARVGVLVDIGSLTEGSTASGGQTLTYTFTRDGNINQTSTVEWRVNASSGVTADDFVNPVDGLSNGGLPSGLITFAEGANEATVTLTLRADSTYEQTEAITLALSAPSNGTSVHLTNGSATTSVTDDDVLLRFTSASLAQTTVAEGDQARVSGSYASMRGSDTEFTELTYTVERVGNTGIYSATTWTLVPRDGANSSDFVGPLTGQLTWNANDTTVRTISVKVRSDLYAEGNEGFQLNMSTSTLSNSVDANSSVNVTITDADEGLTVASNSALVTRHAEGQSGETEFSWTIQRTGNLSQALDVDYQVTGTSFWISEVDFRGTAGGADGTDFVGGTLPSGRVSFAAGQATATITVRVVGDIDVEASETFGVRLTPARTIDQFSVTSGQFQDQTELAYLNSNAMQELLGVIVRDESIISIVNAEVTSPTNHATLGVANAPAEGDSGYSSHFFKIFRTLSVEGDVSVDWRVSGLGAGDVFVDTPLFTQERRVGLSASDFVSAEDPNVANAGYPSGRATIAAGQDFVVIEVRTRTDLTAEDLAGFQVTISNPSPGSSVSDTVSTAYIRNDDPLFSVGEVYPTQPDGVGAGSHIWNEGDGDVTFRIYRSGSTSGTAEADWEVRFAGLVSGPNGALDASVVNRYSASASDFDTTSHPLSGTVVFADGEAFKEVTLRLADDQTAENFAETFRIALTAARVTEPGSTKVAAISTVAGSMEQVLIDNDHGSVVAITNVVTSEGALTFSEGTSVSNKTVTYTLTRSGADLSAGQIGWYVTGAHVVSVTGNTGSSGHSGLISFAAGETSKTLTLELSNNSWAQDNATQTLTLVDAKQILTNYSDSNGGATPFALDAPFYGSDGSSDALRNGIYLVDSANAREPGGSGDSNHTGLLPNGGSIVVSPTQASASVTVVNDDTRVFLRDTLGGSPYMAVLEPDSGTVDLTIRMGREGRTDQTLLVDYTIVLGTADSADVDSTLTGTLTLSAAQGGGSTYGNLNYEFTLEDLVFGDTTVEANESFNVRFSNLRTDAGNSANLYFQQANSYSNTGQLSTIDLPVWLENTDVTWSVTATPTQLEETDTGERVYTFTISRPITGNNYSGAATVNWTVEGVGDHPTNADDFVGGVLGGSVNFASGEASKQVTVRVKGDMVAEQNETFTVGIVSATRGQVDATRTTMTVLNEDTSISVSDAVVTEGNSGETLVTYTITRTGSLSNATTGTWTLLLNGTATDPDFTGATTGSFSFPADANFPRYGEQTTTFTVRVAGDTLPEAHETFSVRLSNLTNIDDPSATGVNKLTGTGTIRNDESVFSITAGEAVTEGDVTGQRFVITRSHDTAQSQTVTWAVGTEGGSHGVSASDFAGGTYPGGDVTFAPGVLEIEIFVPSLADSTAEVDEAFTVTLLPGTGTTAAMVQNALAYGSIVNDDAGPVVVTPDAFLVVSDALGVVEGHSGSGMVEFTITRSGAMGFAGTVNWAVALTSNASNNADASDFGGTLPSGTATLAAGQSTITIQVPVSGDNLLEGDETFHVVLSDPSPGFSLTDDTGLGTIVNDDARYDIDNAVSAYASAPATAEGTSANPTTITFTVTRTGNTSAAGTVNWDVARRDADVAFGTGDFVTTGGASFPSGTLSFGAGESSKTVSVQVVADSTPELDETFRIRLTSPSTGHTIGAMNSFFKVTNDDTDVIGMSSAQTTVSEGDAAGFTEFTFTLSRTLALTTTSVTWTVSPVGDNQLDISRLVQSTGTATFDIGALTTTVTIRVPNDIVGDFDRTFRVAISDPVVTLPDGSVDTVVGAVISPQAGFLDFTLDNDDPAYTLQLVNNGRFIEGDGGTGAFIQFYVYRDGDTTGSANMDWALSPGATNPVNISDFGGFWPSGTIAFAEGETEKLIQARVAGDGKYELDETFRVTLSNLRSDVSGARLLVSEVVGTIANDDNGVTIAMASGSERVTEGDSGTTSVAFDVSAVGVAGESVTVHYVIEGFGPTPGNAEDLNNGNYGTGSLTLRIGSNGTASDQVWVNVRGDTTFGPDENLRLRVTQVVNGALADNQGTFTIVNDDSLVSVQRADGEGATVLEGSSGTVTRTFVLTRAGDLSRASVVNYEVTGAGDNPASASDFVGGTWPAGSVVFAANESRKEVTVTINSDTAFESTEGFIFRLTPGNASGNQNVADIDIAASELRTDIVNDDSASLSVVAVRDSVLEGTETASTLIYRVVRNGSVESPLTVTYTLSDNTLRNGSVSTAVIAEPLTGTVVIAAGDDTAELVFTSRPDAEISDNSFFLLQVSAPGFANPAAVEGAIYDDDSGISAAWVNSSMTEGNTGGSTFAVVITRSGTNLGATEVNWSVRGAGHNPTDATDWTGAAWPAGTVRFAAGELEKTVTFSVNDDASVENAEAFVFELTGSSDSTQLIRTGALVGQITDNDVVTNGGDLIATGNGVDVINAQDGNDTIVAGAGADVIDAGAGDDEIHTGGGMDQVTAGAGNDLIFMGPIDWAANSDLQWHVNGGEGFDVLLFDGTTQGQTIDLDELVTHQRVVGIEMLHITGGGNNTLLVSSETLLQQDVGVFPDASAQAATQHQLLVMGDATTTIDLVDSGWTQESGVYTYGGHDYMVYSHANNQTQVLIHQGMTVI